MFRQSILPLYGDFRHAELYGDWVYCLVMHQAFLFENKEQYDKAGYILTKVLANAVCKSHINKDLFDAFSAFLAKLVEKE